MPSQEATALTRRHRAELALVVRLVRRRLGRVLTTAEAADIDRWWDSQAARAQRIVSGGARAAAASAVRYMRQHAAIEGVDLDPVRAEPNLEQIDTSLRVMGPVAFKTHFADSGSVPASLRAMGSQLQGTASRLTLNGDRYSVLRTFRSRGQIAGWRRVTDGNPCSFCAMLASRGAVYSRRGDFQAHNRCGCTAEPLYRQESEPASVLALRDQWTGATAGLSGKEALNAFRRSLTGG